MKNNWTPGYLYVMSVPYVAGISAMPELLQIGGYRFTGFIWVMMLLLGPIIYFLQNTRTEFPIWFWGPWFGYMLLSLTWVEQFSTANLQDAGQMFTPLVVGLVASSVIRNEQQLRSLIRGFAHCLLILAGAYVVSQLTHFEAGARTMALTGCFVGCVYLADMPSSARNSILGWAACVGLAAVTGSRMATLALLIIWSAYPLYPWKRKPLPAMGFSLLRTVLPVALGLALLLIPNLGERVLGSAGDGVAEIVSGDIQVSGSGRFEVWPALWEESKRHLVLGSGVGESGKFVPRFWPGVDKPHNDYLRIVFELGIVGLALFLFAMIAQMIHLRRKIRRCVGEHRRAAVAVYLALVVLLVVSITENTLVYGVWFMHPLFVLLGAIYGVKQTRRVLIRQPLHTRVSHRSAVEPTSTASGL